MQGLKRTLRLVACSLAALAVALPATAAADGGCQSLKDEIQVVKDFRTQVANQLQGKKGERDRLQAEDNALAADQERLGEILLNELGAILDQGKVVSRKCAHKANGHGGQTAKEQLKTLQDRQRDDDALLATKDRRRLQLLPQIVQLNSDIGMLSTQVTALTVYIDGLEDIYKDCQKPNQQ